MKCHRCGQARGQGSYFCAAGKGGVPHFYPVENLYGGVVLGKASADPERFPAIRVSNGGQAVAVPTDPRLRGIDGPRVAEVPASASSTTNIGSSGGFPLLGVPPRVTPPPRYLKRGPFSHLAPLEPETHVLPFSLELGGCYPVSLSPRALVHLSTCFQVPSKILQIKVSVAELFQGTGLYVKPEGDRLKELQNAIVLSSFVIGIDHYTAGPVLLSTFLENLPTFKTAMVGQNVQVAIENKTERNLKLQMWVCGVSTVR